MSRAFVKEEDAEISNLRADAGYRKKQEEWLRIQEKKRDMLMTEEKISSIDPQKRAKWLADLDTDIEKTRRELEAGK